MKRVAPDFWEEHCVECGAPACYATCEKFKRAPGGVCRRIEDGRFLPWGKRELFWQGRVAGRCARAVLNVVFAVVGPVVRMLFSEMMLRGLRRRVTALVGRKGLPDGWEIQCRSEYDETLFAAVANFENEDLLIRKLPLKPGQNEFFIPLPRVPSRSFFRIYSIEGTNGRVVFGKCDVGEVEKKAKSAQFVKCVVWDLDNTLWSGILANDGASGVKVRAQVVAAIKELDRRGILNTICSKNDEPETMAALRQFGLADYFVFPAINWNPKSENIAKIAKDINIGLDTLAFVDDSPHERGEVSERLPMVRVFDENAVEAFLALPEMNPPVSAESSRRRLSYLAEMRRRGDEKQTGGDHEAFLRSCEIELTLCKVGDEAVRRRCWELVNRTNQLTLAAHRYTESEFCELLEQSESWAISCRDKYGDYGIVGYVALRSDEIVEFVMSCRVAKKCCEQSVLLALADGLKSKGRYAMFAKVVATGRNKALIEAFDVMPFRKTVGGSPDETHYELDLADDWTGLFRNVVKREQ